MHEGNGRDMEQVRGQIVDVLRVQGEHKADIRDLKEFKQRVNADFYGVPGSGVKGMKAVMEEFITLSHERDRQYQEAQKKASNRQAVVLTLLLLIFTIMGTVGIFLGLIVANNHTSWLFIPHRVGATLSAPQEAHLTAPN